MKREAITPIMKIKAFLFGYKPLCAICLGPLRPDDKIEWDHIHALVHSGPHEYENLRPLHAECHKRKTKADVQANAKVKRILANKPSKRPMKSSGRKIPSRPFSKRLTSKPIPV